MHADGPDLLTRKKRKKFHPTHGPDMFVRIVTQYMPSTLSILLEDKCYQLDYSQTHIAACGTKFLPSNKLMSIMVGFGPTFYDFQFPLGSKLTVIF